MPDDRVLRADGDTVLRGTPIDGGAVVIHYPTHRAVLLSLYAADNGDPVFILRQKGFPGERYHAWVADPAPTTTRATSAWGTSTTTT